MRLNERMRRIDRRKWMMLGAYPLSEVMWEVDWNQLRVYLSSRMDSPAILRSRGNGTSRSLTGS